MTDNTLVRSEPCPECGAEMLWTQNAWRAGKTSNAAYRCLNGHVLDPATTRQCPQCGIHDTFFIGVVDDHRQHRCARCGALFQVPR
jgi:endogenous inhibitor of DNA gyrase (YacG/DUF329 family)